MADGCGSKPVYHSHNNAPAVDAGTLTELMLDVIPFCLDLPTFEDPLVQRQLEDASSTSGSIAWDTLVMASGIVSTAIQVVSQVSVLARVLGAQQDGMLLAILSFSSSLSDWVTRWNVLANGQGGSPPMMLT